MNKYIGQIKIVKQLCEAPDRTKSAKLAFGRQNVLNFASERGFSRGIESDVSIVSAGPLSLSKGRTGVAGSIGDGTEGPQDLSKG